MVLYYGLFALQTANNIIAGYRPERERKSLSNSSEHSWIYTEDLKKRYHDSRYILIPVYTDQRNGHRYVIPYTFEQTNSSIDYRTIVQQVSRSKSTTYGMTNPHSTIEEQVTNRKSRLRRRLRSFFLSIY